ncbi:hypothetical protein ACIQVL_19700 [Streptomyces sp. NPDC090499]|uniref:hypothetical protein n=1 Tax=unclassified Streptomyces TaxID=2593676 RepID=UPI003806DC43
MFRLPRLAAVTALALALGLLATTPAVAGGPTVSDPRVLAHFDLAAGQTPENIALVPDGSVDVTLAYARQVANVSRNGATRILATLPDVANPKTPLLGRALVTGIARADDGTLFVDYATGTSETGIWRIDPGGGAPRQIAQLPPGGLPNGLALDERRGALYVADSVLGTVWRVPCTGGTPAAWAGGAALEPGSPVPPAYGIGVNGLRFHNGAVWVSNTDAGTVLRIPVEQDGSAGAIETRATGLAGIDDFNFVSRHSDTALAALMIANQVALIQADGSHTIVLTQQSGLSNPSSVAVRGHTAYVTNSGYFSQPGGEGGPNLLVARVHQRYPGQ